MAWSGSFAFADPELYQAAVRPAQVRIFVTTKGNFHAELTRIEMPRLWVQRGHENLPRVVYSTVTADRPPIFFLAGSEQAAILHTGMEFGFGEIAAAGAGSTHHHRTVAPCHWATLSLTREDLAAAGHALVGRELTVPSVTHRLRPAPVLMSRLLNLHEAAGRLAETSADTLSQPEPVRALEEALIHAMIMCLSDGAPVETSSNTRRHSAIIARFEEFLASNHDRPLYLAEICTTVGASERTLRTCCQEHLGMGPVRYLWLRRMHLARRALIAADQATATVTEIAMNHGFWELGRFSVAYRALFGEAPSASLRRPPDDGRKSQDRPPSVPASESA
jgi:AraC-like DNA-binding protein